MYQNNWKVKKETLLERSWKSVEKIVPIRNSSYMNQRKEKQLLTFTNMEFWYDLSFIRQSQNFVNKYDWPFLKLTQIYNSRKSRVIMISTVRNFLQYSVFLNWLPQHTVDVENLHSVNYVVSIENKGCCLGKTKSAFP